MEPLLEKYNETFFRSRSGSLHRLTYLSSGVVIKDRSVWEISRRDGGTWRDCDIHVSSKAPLIPFVGS